MNENWNPKNNTDIPLFIQFSDFIKNEIRSGRLRSNTRLPSERELAKRFGISRNTVKLALSRLVTEGMVVTKPQSGTFVASLSWRRAVGAKSVDWASMFNFGRSVLVGNDEKGGNYAGLLNISARRPNEKDSFFKRFFDAGLFDKFQTTKLYSDDVKSILGSDSLREALSTHLKHYGISANPEEILLVSSTNQAIHIISEAFLGQGINFYYETAGYLNIRGSVASVAANKICLPFDDEGICVDKLKKQALFNKKAVLHIQPSNEHPTGITASLGRRQEIVRLFCNNLIPVIELDSMIDIWAETPPLPPIKSMDKHNSVIFVGNMAKSTSEDISITWIVADEYIINDLAVIKMKQDKHVNTFVQVAADLALRTGFYYEYMDYFRKFLLDRRDAYNEIMQKYLADFISWHPTRSSYYFWPEFVPEIKTAALFEKCRGVMFFPGYYYDVHDTNHISICTLAMPPDDFKIAAARLRKAAESVLNKKR